ncbi:MAG: FHA domain-containing protein [Sedimentisphaerales bacterium]|nr:FHA domain-containing protein [Sedimentisphaerales bacterium]
MASIIVTSGEQKGEFLPLGKRTNVIGRAENLPLQILDRLISRKHLRIFFDQDAGKYYAEDLKSKHGVFLNKHKITDVVALSESDEILIGNVTLMFTDKDFEDKESALSHYKKVGEQKRSTLGQ